MALYERDGELWPTWLDPGAPVYIGGDQTAAIDSMYKHHFAMVSIWQSHHDPFNGVMIDASPASIGNAPELPTDYLDYGDFYNYFGGGDAGTGHDVNPHTGLPYQEQLVRSAIMHASSQNSGRMGQTARHHPDTGSASSTK